MVILAYRPVQEIEEILNVRVTGAGLADGNAETYFDLDGQPRKTSENPGQVFQALRITGTTLTGCYRPRYLNIQRLNYLWTIQHSSARIASNLIT
jgi:hypothetical protein